MKWAMSEGMKVGTAWVLWGFVSLGVLGWGLLVVLEYVGSLQDAPAWVQAIGSIGAILAAVAIAQRGVIQQRHDRLLEGYEFMQKAFGVAAYAKQVIAAASQYILEGAPTEFMLRYHVSLLELSLEDLRGIDHARLDDPGVAESFLALKRNVNLTRSAILLRLESEEGFNVDQVSAWGPYSHDEISKMSGAMICYLARHPRLLDEIHARQLERL